MTDVVCNNAIPEKSFGFSVNIPPNSPVFTQTFPYSANLSEDNFNYISRVTVRIDTTGIWNIPINETFKLNGVNTNIAAGNYNTSQLETLANVTIPVTGANAFLATNTQSLQFPLGSHLQFVLGYTSFGTNLIPASTIATSTLNQTGGYDFLAISSSLISPGGPFGSNYLVGIPINVQAGQAVASTQNVVIPIVSTQFQSIIWSLYNAFGQPYNINSPVTIFIQIDVQKKYSLNPNKINSVNGMY